MKSLIKKLVISILTLEARLVLKKYKPRIIAVTGSVGKTSTKDAIAAALHPHFFIRASVKSYNSEIGIPLTILGQQSGWGSTLSWMKVLFEGVLLIVLKNHYPSVLVLEAGVGSPGDMKKTVSFISPDIVVITRFAKIPVHLEFFPSRDALIEEKKMLARNVRQGGTLVLNADDEEVFSLRREKTPALKSVSYGFREHADVLGSSARILYGEDGMPTGVEMRVTFRGKGYSLRLRGSLGAPILYAALASVATGIALGISPRDVIPALRQFRSEPGRMRPIRGVNGSLIIDDSYNSSPVAARVALATLDEIKTAAPGASAGGAMPKDHSGGARKIALLGDMLELGKESMAEHRKVGAYAADVCDILVTVGVRAEGFEDGARSRRMKKSTLFHFGTAEEAGKFLRDFLEPGDVILVKGSQSGIRLEKAIKIIMAEPARAKELLVRQESEWQNR